MVELDIQETQANTLKFWLQYEIGVEEEVAKEKARKLIEAGIPTTDILKQRMIDKDNALQNLNFRSTDIKLIMKSLGVYKKRSCTGPRSQYLVLVLVSVMMFFIGRASHSISCNNSYEEDTQIYEACSVCPEMPPAINVTQCNITYEPNEDDVNVYNKEPLEDASLIQAEATKKILTPYFQVLLREDLSTENEMALAVGASTINLLIHAGAQNELRLSVVQALHKLSLHQEWTKYMVAIDVIPLLTQWLADELPPVRLAALGTLSRIASHEDLRAAVIKSGAILELTSLLGHDSITREEENTFKLGDGTSSTLEKKTLELLHTEFHFWNSEAFQARKLAMIRNGAIPLLVNIMTYGTVDGYNAAFDLLKTFTFHSDESADILAKALIDLVHGRYRTKKRKQAAKVLLDLSRQWATFKDMLQREYLRTFQEQNDNEIDPQVKYWLGKLSQQLTN